MDTIEASTRIVEAILAKVNLNALVHNEGRGMEPEAVSKEVGENAGVIYKAVHAATSNPTTRP